MSASLVGSEMCIRDSYCTAANAQQRSNPFGAVKSGFLRPSTLLSPGGPCLLYTSDAADDM
eukprot:5339229-Alexandrium_andersonii.AAC.1